MNPTRAVRYLSVLIISLVVGACSSATDSPGSGNLVTISLRDASGQPLSKADVAFIFHLKPTTLHEDPYLDSSKAHPAALIAYPNPIASVVSLNFSQQRSNAAKIWITDYERRTTLKTIQDTTLAAGTYTYDYTLADKPNGGYWYNYVSAGDTEGRLIIKNDLDANFKVANTSTDQSGIFLLSFSSYPFDQTIQQTFDDLRTGPMLLVSDSLTILARDGQNHTYKWDIAVDPSISTPLTLQAK